MRLRLRILFREPSDVHSLHGSKWTNMFYNPLVKAHELVVFRNDTIQFWNIKWLDPCPKLGAPQQLKGLPLGTPPQTEPLRRFRSMDGDWWFCHPLDGGGVVWGCYTCCTGFPEHSGWPEQVLPVFLVHVPSCLLYPLPLLPPFSFCWLMSCKDGVRRDQLLIEIIVTLTSY